MAEHLHDKSGNSTANRIFVIAVNIFFVLSLITVYQNVMHNLKPELESISFGQFEFFINYEAGFIRRGLPGQILYWIAETTHIDIRVLITVFVIPPWIFVLSFLLYKFRKYGIRWWLLAIIVYGMLLSIIRKDFIIYTLFIALLYIYKSRLSISVRISSMSLVSVIMLLIYEPSMFFCLGYMALLVLRDKSMSKIARATYPILLCITMLIMLKSTGSTGIGDTIYDSWLKIYPDGFAIPDYVKNSLDWSVSDSLRFNHERLMPEFHPFFLFKYLLFILLVPYIYITYMYVDTYKSPIQFPYSPSIFTTLFLFFMLCMLPMWIGLSCDYGRMLYHATLSSLCVAFIVPEKLTSSTFPRWALNISSAINRLFSRIPRTIYSITLLMIIFTPGYTFFYTPHYHLKIDSLLIRVMIDAGDFLHIILSHIFH